jgi:hypothetical protein
MMSLERASVWMPVVNGKIVFPMTRDNSHIPIRTVKTPAARAKKRPERPLVQTYQAARETKADLFHLAADRYRHLRHQDFPHNLTSVVPSWAGRSDFRTDRGLKREWRGGLFLPTR